MMMPFSKLSCFKMKKLVKFLRLGKIYLITQKYNVFFILQNFKKTFFYIKNALISFFFLNDLYHFSTTFIILKNNQGSSLKSLSTNMKMYNIFKQQRYFFFSDKKL